MARAPRARFLLSAGFTLIEMAVVMLILAIILGLVGVRLTRDQSDIVRDEARRLALLLQNAQQQAILEGRPYGFMLTADGYRFLQLDDQNRLVPVQADALLRARVLPPAVSLEPLGREEETEEEMSDEDANRRADLIVFDPSGTFAAFTMMFQSDEIVWYVQGRTDGRILSTPLRDPAAT